MNKSRILSVALTAAMVASVAAVSTIGASAATINSPSEISEHSVGIVGGFDNGAWSTDIPMSDDDGDGVYEGTIEIESVAQDMLSEDGTLQFKIRLDASWDNSWGAYELEYDRTENSQINCAVPATVGEPLTVNVKFDTTSVNPEALENSESGAHDEEQLLYYLNVSYEVVESAAADDTAADDTTADDTAADDTTADDTTVEESDAAPVETGDATSAVALAAVVVASLGTAVVMTKKASAKN